MNFEKRMKKRGNQKLDKFAKNPYRVPWFKRIPTWAKVAIPSVMTATAAICVVMIVMPYMSARGKAYSAHLIDNGDRYQNSDVDTAYAPGQDGSRTNQSMDGVRVKTWTEKTIIEKYPAFTYNTIEYQVRYTDSTQPINESYVNVKIADISVQGYDVYQKANHNESAEIFSIKNIANDVSLAIKFSGGTDYYAYQNVGLTFATVGELMDKLSFASEVNINYVNYYDYSSEAATANAKYTNCDENTVYGMLFNDLTIAKQLKASPLKAPNSSAGHSATNNESGMSGPTVPEEQNKWYTISLSIPALGINNAGMYFYESGKLIVNLFGTQTVFNLGEERYQQFGTYLANNATSAPVV